MEKKEPVQRGKEIQLVIFKLRGEEFGSEISSVLEISRALEITRIPQAPGFIKGVINLRGQVVALISLAQQFALPEEKELPKTARIVIVEVGGQILGLIVDEVLEVLRVAEASIEPPPEIIQAQVKRDYIKGVAKLGERLVIILDMNKVLAPHELNEAGRVVRQEE